MQEMDKYEIETHPWEPWLPENAKVLFMGTFPPGVHRWSMDFYYPNPINDFWRICSLLLLGDKDVLYDKTTKSFNLNAIKAMTIKHGIAMSDTVKRARRLKGNASDKFLEVIEGNDPIDLITRIPLCRAIATTGEKATDVIASLTGTERPKMGEFSIWHPTPPREIAIWRMPSTSRAYPLKLEKKAEYYANLFNSVGIDTVDLKNA